MPDAQRNSMEPILLELQPGGPKSNELPPLESEEFGYVLHGQVNLVAGKRTYRVRKGFSFCLHPNTTHYLENTGARPRRHSLDLYSAKLLSLSHAKGAVRVMMEQATPH